MKNLTLRLGTCEHVNDLLIMEVERIDGHITRIVPCPKPSFAENGLMSISGTELLVDGELVASGYQEISNWLNYYHRQRVVTRHKQQIYPQLATAGI